MKYFLLYDPYDPELPYVVISEINQYNEWGGSILEALNNIDPDEQDVWNKPRNTKITEFNVLDERDVELLAVFTDLNTVKQNHPELFI